MAKGSKKGGGKSSTNPLFKGGKGGGKNEMMPSGMKPKGGKKGY